MRSVPFAWTAAVLAVAASLAGCLGDSGTQKVKVPPGLPPSPTGPPEGNVSAEPPVADFFPSANPATIGRAVRFDASKSADPAGGNLTFVWAFGDGAADAGAVVEHAYAAAGVFRVELTARSDASGLTGLAALPVTVVDPATLKRPAVATDPDTDGKTDYSDLLRVSAFDSGGRFLLTVALQDLQPLYDTASVVLVAFTINDAQYEAYGSAGETGLYDVSRDADVPGAEVVADDAANTVSVKVALAELAPKLPFRIVVETRAGEPTAAHGLVADDRAPDRGELAYPPA